MTKARGGDDAFFAYFSVVHDDGVHADERVAADAAAVQDGAVPYVAVGFDDRVAAGEAVHDAGVLEIAAGLENEAAEIAAQNGLSADVAAWADDDIADEDGGGVHEGGGVDDRDDAFELVDVSHGICFQG